MNAGRERERNEWQKKNTPSTDTHFCVYRVYDLTLWWAMFLLLLGILLSLLLKSLRGLINCVPICLNYNLQLYKVSCRIFFFHSLSSVFIFAPISVNFREFKYKLQRMNISHEYNTYILFSFPIICYVHITWATISITRSSLFEPHFKSLILFYRKEPCLTMNRRIIMVENDLHNYYLQDYWYALCTHIKYLKSYLQ